MSASVEIKTCKWLMRGGVAACVTRQSRRHQPFLTLVFPWQVLRDVSIQYSRLGYEWFVLNLAIKVIEGF